MSENPRQLRFFHFLNCKSASAEQDCLDGWEQMNKDEESSSFCKSSEARLDQPVIVRAVASGVQHAVEGQGYQT